MSNVNFLAQVSPWAEIQIGEQLSLFSPMLALVCTMLAIVVCPMIFGRGARVTGAVACLGIIATLILVLRTAGAVADGGLSGLSTDPGAGLLLVDNLSVCFQLILVAFLAGVTWLWWIGRAENERNAPEFFILLIGSALGMALMVSTSNLLMIVVAMETASLPCYAIVGFDKRSKVGAEASLKYVVFGAMCAATMLYGMRSAVRGGRKPECVDDCGLHGGAAFRRRAESGVGSRVDLLFHRDRVQNIGRAVPLLVSGCFRGCQNGSDDLAERGQ